MDKIEQQIANWRSELTTHEAILTKNVDELEDHLRTSMTRLVDQGLSKGEAFFIAAKRVGTGNKLSDEFHKVNTGSIRVQRLRWLIYGLLLFQVLSGLWVLVVERIGMATGVGSYSLMLSSSNLVGGIQSGVVAAILLIGIWIVIKNIAREGAVSNNRLILSLQKVFRREIITITLVIGALMLHPFMMMALRMVGSEIVSQGRFIDFLDSTSVYQRAAGFLLPILWAFVLILLNQQRRPNLKI